MLEQFLLHFEHVLYVFFISMLPIAELRAAIPVGAAFGLPWGLNYLICVVGNMLPVPFILLFIRKILQWMKTKKRLAPIAVWVEQKAQKNSRKVQQYAALGLILFVGIPIPGTGAWTGALIAAMLDMRFKYALPAIAVGVLIAGFIMAGVSYGFLGFLSFLA